MDAEAARAQVEDITRLKSRKRLTLLFDGWEDKLRRSLYGTIAAEQGELLCVLSLDELTGDRGTAQKYLETTKGALKKMDLDDGLNFIALTTDNPTVMQAYRQLMQNTYYWILVSSVAVLLLWKLKFVTDLALFSAWPQYYYREDMCIPCNETCHITDGTYRKLLQWVTLLGRTVG
jgi:hypothetical protein